eukprot:gb/GEZN01003884.1/.p1 GENE.gb/GEZN01003884.1/~~gb/GEZN01003884.1/.p1  ORF type:complete len:531 (-),score=88.18 gb/GEZN01003884.1/:436-2028(-)
MFGLLFTALFGGSLGSSQVLSPGKCLVYGPGLDPGVSSPARYVFLQAVDTEGKNFTSSPGLDAFSVAITMIVGGKQYAMNVAKFDRGDGSFAFRFFFNQVPNSITISIKYQEKSVAASPYVLKKPLPEKCNCPRADPAAFTAAYSCPATYPQLEQDLEWFRSSGGVTRALLDEAVQKLNNGRNCFVHYVIKNNQIFSKQYGPMGGFQKFLDEVLHSLARKVRLPDVEFLFNLGDWPLAYGSEAERFPVISWCGSQAPNRTSDIAVPTYKQTLGTLFGKDLESAPDVDGQCFTEGAPWASKIEKALFRGRDSSAVRTELANGLGKTRADLIDAKVTQNHMNYFPNDEARAANAQYEAKYGPKTPRIKFFAFWKWKYLLNLDGTVAAYRMPALLAGNSLVLKQESSWYETFYAELKPWVHYVPVKADLSDLVEKIEWAKTHDQEAQQIATNGRLYARQNLTQASIYCYYFTTLQGYSQLLSMTPERAVGMTAAVDSEAAHCDCSATHTTTHHSKKKKKKKKKKAKDTLKDEL